MTHLKLPREIEVYEIGARRLYVKMGLRNIAISEDDLTPEELMGIAGDIAARRAVLSGIGAEARESRVGLSSASPLCA